MRTVPFHVGELQKASRPVCSPLARRPVRLYHTGTWLELLGHPRHLTFLGKQMRHHLMQRSIQPDWEGEAGLLFV